MKTLEDVKRDLKSIKEFYSIQNSLRNNEKMLVSLCGKEVLGKYEKIMETAPPEIQIVYFTYYHSSITIENYMSILGVSKSTINRKIRNLQDYLIKKL